MEQYLSNIEKFESQTAWCQLYSIHFILLEILDYVIGSKCKIGWPSPPKVAAFFTTIIVINNDDYRI